MTTVGQLGNGTTAIGMSALANQLIIPTGIGIDVTAYGHEALQNLAKGVNECTAFGSQALSDSAHGENSAFGAYAATRCGGTGNTAHGGWSMRNVNGNYNTSVGHRSMAGDNNTEIIPTAAHVGSYNTANGYGTYRAAPEGTYNTASGYNAMNKATGTNVDYNSAYGSQSLMNLKSNGSTTSIGNTAVGKDSGLNIESGNHNTALGTDSCKILTTGNKNTLVGYKADVSDVNSMYRTSIGAESLVTQDNSIVLGRVGIDMVGIGTTAPDAMAHIVASNDKTAIHAVSSNGVAINVDGGMRIKTQVVNNTVAQFTHIINSNTYMIIVKTSYASMSAPYDIVRLPELSSIDDGRVFIIKNASGNTITIDSANTRFNSIDTNLLAPTLTLFSSLEVIAYSCIMLVYADSVYQVISVL
jgi:hypothetical protein